MGLGLLISLLRWSGQLKASEGTEHWVRVKFSSSEERDFAEN